MATTKKQGPRLKSSHGGHTPSPPRKGPPADLSAAAHRIKNGAAGRRKAAPRPSTRPRPEHAPSSGGPRMKKAKPQTSPPATGGVGASEAARAIAIAIAVAALEKKAVGLEILDVAGKVDYADFLVIMTGRSDRQVQALAQSIEEELKKKGQRPLAVEGLPHASWVLMDFGDVVVHVFQEDARSLYDIEGLWLDARRIPVPVPDELR